MKCIYAIPPEDSEVAKRLAKRYAQALTKLSDDVIILGDDLRAFAEKQGTAVLKLEDDDWATAMSTLVIGDRAIFDEIFWPSDLIYALFGDQTDGAIGDRAIGLWFEGQSQRQRSFLLLWS